MQIIIFKRSKNKIITIFFMMFFLFSVILSSAVTVYAADGLNDEVIVSSPASIQPPNDDSIAEDNISNSPDFVEYIRKLSPKSFSGVFTIAIFIILCFIMLYLKFRKGNTNNE